ncbi:MAG: PIN domain-containing protein [Candidatus Bathyarchaeota archaeon]|nr:PIN domain-containing protein [Candidatus Bathyarchaeota archaeon]
MVSERVSTRQTRPLEAVIDVGPIVLAHFQNPAQDEALKLLSDVLRTKRRCLIPTSTLLGAYHIMTRYLRVESTLASEALVQTLSTRSPSFYPDIDVETAHRAISHASGFRIESWDGYLVALAEKESAPVIYSMDEEFSKKVRSIRVINPLPEDVYEEYKDWMRDNINR